MSNRSKPDNSSGGFSLIEIMIVVGLIGILVGIGIPSFVTAMRKEGMRRAVSDMVEACSHARAQAILNGAMAELVIHPLEGTMQVVGSSIVPAGDSGETTSVPGAATFSYKIPENVVIELLGVNFLELQDAEVARVRFFPNGTSDEFTIVLRSDQQEYRKISLEVVTALADVEIIR